MAVDQELLSAFATAATAGVGHGVGRAFINWFFERWRWLTGSTPATDPVIRSVTPAQLEDGLPKGTVLCRYEGDHLVQKYLPGDPLPDTVAKGETLWLVPVEERWLNANFDVSDAHYAVQVGVEVDPQSGQGLQPAEIASMNWDDVGGLLSGLLTGLAVGGGLEALAKGEPEAIRKSQQKLNESLRKRGLRCKGIRPAPTPEALQTVASSGGGNVSQGIPGELVGELEHMQTPEAWNQFINTLSASGVPWTQGTLNQLQQMQDQFLKQQVSSEKTVRSLAQLTEAAFVEAGIEELNLSRCQAISRCLQAEETTTAAPELASVSVVSSSRPSTWYVWTQAEADRRLIDYTRRSLRHCKAACEQALRSIRHLPSLRQLRDWNEQLTLTTELLDSAPNLKPRTSSLRANSSKTKELSKLLQDTAITSEQLSQHGKKLFDQPAGSPEWEQTLRACQQSTSILQQLIQDRRNPH